MPYKIDVPPSKVASLIKNSNDKELSEKILAKPDRARQKEIEVGQKAGTIPALKNEDGNDINPHTPLYIMQTPWYYNQLQPTLKHQSNLKEQHKKLPIDRWYKRGTSGIISKSFKAGSCTNCGATTHNSKSCFERPRKVSVKYDENNIAEDDFIQPDILSGYDEKRDRWNNYDINKYEQINDEYEKIEEERKKIKTEIVDNMMIADKPLGSEEENLLGNIDQKLDPKQRITVRNLRLREDTAKYLYNLDPNSAFYDPKSRSMRDNPFKNKNIEFEQQPHRGDNEFLCSKDIGEFYKKQVFAWDQNGQGKEVNLQALPTITEKVYTEHLKEEVEKSEKFKEKLFEQYGGKEHLKSRDDSIDFNEDYSEYSVTGKPKSFKQKKSVMSKYPEDQYDQNHSSIYGSYYNEGKWGYKCCKSLMRNSYCLKKNDK